MRFQRRVSGGRLLTLAVALWTVAVGPAAAQRVLLSTDGTTALDLGTGTVLWTTPTPIVPAGAVHTADGRYAVGARLGTSTSPSVRVVEAATGTYFDVPISFQPTVAHPRDPVLFGLANGQFGFDQMQHATPARLDATGLTLYPGCPPGTASALDASGDASRLFVLCESGSLAVIDVASATVLNTLTLSATTTYRSTYDGTMLLVANFGAHTMSLVDVITGNVVQNVAAPDGCSPSVQHISPDRRLALVGCTSLPGFPLPQTFSTPFSLESMTWGVPYRNSGVRIVSISPDNRTAYSTFVHRTGAYGSVQAHDIATGMPVASARIIGDLVVSYPPLALVATSTVTGNQVALSWTTPRGSPVATAHTLEIGTGPGLSNLGTVVLGPQTSLTVPGVPTGRYYVRLRARNFTGLGAVSNELVVDVP